MMKKIFVITDHDYIGGAEVNYRETLREFHNRGYKITFVAPGFKNLNSFFHQNGINEISYLSLPRKYFSLKSSKGKISIVNCIKNFISLKKNKHFLDRIIAKEKPEAIISNAVFSHYLLAIIETTSIKAAHIQDIINRKSYFGLYGNILDYITSKMNKVITISDAVSSTFNKRDIHKTFVIYNPIKNPSILEQKQNKIFTVGMFARYVEWKGHNKLIEIVELTKQKEIYDIKFISFGNTSGQEDYFNSLKMKSKASGLNDTLQLNPFSPNVLEEMSKCDLILQLSMQPEPFGRILIESNMLKKPIISFEGGGIRELYTNLNLVGRIVPKGDCQKTLEEIILFKNNFYSKLNFPDLNQLNPENYVQNFLKILFDEKNN